MRTVKVSRISTAGEARKRLGVGHAERSDALSSNVATMACASSPQKPFLEQGQTSGNNGLKFATTQLS